ncbi:MJ1477/TM1410 family putative glycoside hydrolase [Phorcysia thermohydrogeniphila]|uniref:Cysteinyl-tRNA synthetase n=1 Tax=Phorcysia thermohydrogeniphila TaxID=936138 RepID=A0A4R1GPY9_9BACT|nr:MJ1477/TM1410 family putative glycoside hydrolase [Phorcysia thermohydrogeniphila]TCK06572.1 cysteinyl-tRNA synthetase [Phorcysia thermohydrogeniphila]
MKRFSFLILFSFLLLGGCGGESEVKEESSSLNVKSWGYQLQEANPSEVALSGFDLVVMDYSYDGTEEGEYSPEEIESIKSSGVIPIAYISVGEAEDYRFYWNPDWQSSPPSWLGEENPEWQGNYAVRYWEQEWKDIVRSYINRIAEEGFKGLYLDKIDEFEYWDSQGELEKGEPAKRMIDFIVEIADYCRKKIEGCYIIPQNGERLLLFDEEGKLLKTVSAWAVEDLFYDGTSFVSQDEVNERTALLDRVRGAGKPVLVVDYVDDGSGYDREKENLERIEDFRRRALEKGYIPYAAMSDRELDELIIIPGLQP